MLPLADFPAKARREIRGVYCDIDDTLTTGGRLPEKGPFPPLLVLGDCGAFEAQKLQPLLDEIEQL